jgi:hypothetical protein
MKLSTHLSGRVAMTCRTPGPGVYNALPYEGYTEEGMERLPKVIASTVVRSAHQGESHGGVYIIDLETEAVDQVIRYDDPSISWEGRGGPRGLRGIAFYEDELYLAASDEIFVYSKELRLVRSIQNEYLSHCHETYVTDGTLYVTSTGRDSVLEYDLRTRSFVKGYHVWFQGPKRQLKAMGFRVRGSKRQLKTTGLRGAANFLEPMPRLQAFDPNSDEGPPVSSNTCHLNSVFYESGLLTVSGTRCAHLLTINGSKLASHARIPYGTHNARPCGEGVLLNDTSNNRLSYLARDGGSISFPIKRYNEEKLLNSHLPQDHTRQAFGRGLCVLGKGLIAGGSSPATVSVYDLNTSQTLKTINLTMDVRNTVHGLEVWPF